jgi:hypothetical protein
LAQLHTAESVATSFFTVTGEMKFPARFFSRVRRSTWRCRSANVSPAAGKPSPRVVARCERWSLMVSKVFFSTVPLPWLLR